MRVFASMLIASALCCAETVPLIPRSVLFGNPEKVAPQMAPDGKHLSWLAPDKGVLNVWIRTTGQQDDHVITNDRLRGIRNYFWQPDGTHIIYAQDVGGNENFHLYSTDIASKETKDLTPFDKVRAGVVKVDRQHPDVMLIEMNKRDSHVMDVYRYTFASGQMDMDTQNPGDVLGWSVDNNNEVRASTTMLPDGSQEIRYRVDTKSPWKVFQKWGPSENPGGPAGFSPDNKELWLESSAGANTSRLLAVDLASGASRVVAEDPQYDVSGVLVNPNSHKLEGVAFVRSRREWQILDPAVRADLDALRKVRDGDVSVVSRDKDDKKWLVAFISDTASPAYYVYDRSTKKAELLFTAIPALDKYRLAKIEPISYPARDRMTIHGYLTMPIGVAKSAPMVLLVHGGPWGRDNWGYNPLVQMLANRGYAVLQPNFRGSTGYGKALLNAGNREWGAKMQDDVTDAKRWAVQQGYADPKRVCIMGGSYGGYATLAGLTFTPDEYACGVDIVGPSNLVTLLKSIPPYWAPMRAMFDQRMGSLEKDEDFLRSRSPLFKADRIRVPLLIGQGANDPRVNQKESDQIVAAMRDNKKPVEYIVFPDEGHGFARPENNLRFFAATDQFLSKYLGGRSETPSEAEKWDKFTR